MKQREQLLFDEIFKISSDALGYDTYISLPDLDVSYPFVVVGETQLIPQPTKTRLIGEITITLNVWSNDGNRVEVSNMLNKLYNAGASIKKIEYTQFDMDLNSSSRILYDNSTNEVLVHGILDLSFKFY